MTCWRARRLDRWRFSRQRLGVQILVPELDQAQGKRSQRLSTERKRGSDRRVCRGLSVRNRRELELCLGESRVDARDHSHQPFLVSLSLSHPATTLPCDLTAPSESSHPRNMCKGLQGVAQRGRGGCGRGKHSECLLTDFRRPLLGSARRIQDQIAPLLTPRTAHTRPTAGRVRTTRCKDS